MDAAVVGSGPAVEAVEAACSDVDVSPDRVDADALADYDLGFVVAPAGAEAFARADDAADRWVAVEIGGVGGRPFDALDAAVSVFAPDSADFSDLRVRVASTAGGGGDGDGGRSDDRPTGDRNAVRFAGAVAGRRAVRLLSGDDVAGTVAEVPGGERRFLPVPEPAARDRTLRRDFREASLDDALSRAERALDDRTGLVTEVGERESFPVPYYLAATADTTAFSDVRAAEFAGGVDADWNAAFVKALGEGLERYCAGVYRATEFATAAERDRAAPVSPARFVRPDGYRDPDPAEPIRWVAGEHLATGESVSLPAEFVHYPPPDERHKPAITTGLGLGNSGAEALLSGLYEVLERDAAMLSWYSTLEPLGLRVDDEGFETLVGRARAEDLSVTPLLVTADVDVPVVAVAVHRDGSEAEWPRFAVGSSADLDAAAAARDALAEALQNWTELRSMGPEAAAREGGAIAEYADFPAPAREFVDVDAGRDGGVSASSVGPDEVPTGAAELDAVVARATDAGLDAYASRVTTADVERLGFEAVRVVIPEAQPLFTGDPFFGSRAESVPRELGSDPALDRPYHPYP